MDKKFEFMARLNQIPNVYHGFFNKEFNIKNINKENIFKYDKSIFEALNIFEAKLFLPSLCHGNNVLILEEALKENDFYLPADAVITNRQNLFLAITFADCLPILLASADGEWVSAIHAGWKGIFLGVIPNAVSALKNKIRSGTEIIAALGPCISADGFIVKEDVFELFKTRFSEFTYEKNGLCHVDLLKVALDQLKSLGINTLEKVGGFTDLMPEKYFSWRKEKTNYRNFAIIGKVNSLF